MEEEILRWQEAEELEYLESLFREDLVARKCLYVSFVSRSKGYSRGRGYPRRKRPQPRRQRGGLEIELLGYGGKFYQIIDGRGPFDDIATEVLEGSVPKEEAEAEFLRRLRKLYSLGLVRSRLRQRL